MRFSAPTLSNPVRQYLDLVNYAFSQTSGQTCAMTNLLVKAEEEARAGKRVCLVDLTLPAGLSAAADGSARFTGRIKNAADNVVGYKISKFFIGKPLEELAVGEVEVPVTPISFAGAVTSDRVSYAKGVQTAKVTAGFSEGVPVPHHNF